MAAAIALTVGAGLSVGASAQPAPVQNACQRACLEGFVNKYLDAMAAHKVDPEPVRGQCPLHRERRRSCRSATRACGRRPAASASTSSTSPTPKPSRSPSSARCWRAQTSSAPPARSAPPDVVGDRRCACGSSTARSPRSSRSPTGPIGRSAPRPPPRRQIRFGQAGANIEAMGAPHPELPHADPREPAPEPRGSDPHRQLLFRRGRAEHRQGLLPVHRRLPAP